PARRGRARGRRRGGGLGAPFTFPLGAQGGVVVPAGFRGVACLPGTRAIPPLSALYVDLVHPVVTQSDRATGSDPRERHLPVVPRASRPAPAPRDRADTRSLAETAAGPWVVAAPSARDDIAATPGSAAPSVVQPVPSPPSPPTPPAPTVPGPPAARPAPEPAIDAATIDATASAPEGLVPNRKPSSPRTSAGHEVVAAATAPPLEAAPRSARSIGAGEDA